MGYDLKPREFHGTCQVKVWRGPSVCPSTGLCSSLPQDLSGGWKPRPGCGFPRARPTPCPPQGLCPLSWERELCKGRRGAFSPLRGHPLFLPSWGLDRISSWGLEVNKDRLSPRSSGLKHKEWESLPPVLNELEREAVGRTNGAEFQSRPAMLMSRLWRRQNTAQTVGTTEVTERGGRYTRRIRIAESVRKI